jgi:TM2 domain-containing membrane protein YozV
VDELLLMKEMTDQQRMLFQSEMNRERKDKTTALLLCIFLGGVGAHRFYLGDSGKGILYLLFFWTFIPSIIALIELFTISATIEKYNAKIAGDVAIRVKMLSQSNN